MHYGFTLYSETWTDEVGMGTWAGGCFAVIFEHIHYNICVPVDIYTSLK